MTSKRKSHKKNKGGHGSTDGEVIRARKPRRNDGDLMAVVTQILGNGRMMVLCDDEETRMARIRGKHRRRMWTRVGDIVIVSPWDFQPERCEIIYRYTKREVSWLENKGYLPDILMP